ncbi:cytidine deaminase [Taibaiella koreensis]|uniref:cytidine deaminase n=1 Tax=Taibaiella koreensis TaxID=1268548 RepID=UPI000E59FFAE|nr:cytidine deaminase [Taibaiella koreensis]
MDTSFSFPYLTFGQPGDLSAGDAALLEAAREATQLAYAPYSGFEVGAALLLDNGAIVKGGNQENASYPAGICAERAALATLSSLYAGMAIHTVAIAYRNKRQPERNELILSPCGICRQSLLEVAKRQDHPIRLIMSNPAGEGLIVDNIINMLPFAFSGDHLH